MSSSWSSGFGRLAAPIAASVSLHLGVGAALDAVPRSAAGPKAGVSDRPAQRLSATLRGPAAPPPAVAESPPRPQPQPPVPPAPLPASGPQQTAEAAPARYFLARELDAKPQALAPIEPAYPNDAFLRNISGRVVVRLHLSETGKVDKAEIVHASPPGHFEEAVRLAFLAASFSPGIRAGRPVRVQMTVEVRYDGPPLEAPAGAPQVPSTN